MNDFVTTITESLSGLLAFSDSCAERSGAADEVFVFLGGRSQSRLQGKPSQTIQQLGNNTQDLNVGLKKLPLLFTDKLYC